MLNVTQIPAARIALTDPIDGTITTQWFRFFVNMYTLQGDGTGVVPVINGGTGQSSYTDGQLLIGDSTGNTLVKNTLTAGSNIAITNGPGTIQLDVTLPSNIVNTFSAGSTGFLPASPMQGNVTLTGNLLSTRIDYTAPFTSAVVRTGNAKWSDFVSVKDFGAVGDGTTNDGPAFQLAIDAIAATGGTIYVPRGTYFINTQVVFSNTVGAITFEGEGWSDFNGVFGSAVPSVRGGGTWLKVTNSSVSPFVINRGVNGIRFRYIGVFEVHPAIGSGWSPTAYQPFFYVIADGFELDHVMFYGVNKGVQIGTTSYATGRAEFNHVWGEFFTYGIDIVHAADVVRFNNYHQYPFWSEYTTNVRNYCLTNTSGIILERNDNTNMNSVFFFGINTGLNLIANAAGSTGKLSIVNIDFDSVVTGIFVNFNQVAADNYLTMHVSNLQYQYPFGDTSATGRGVFVNGNNHTIQFVNLDFSHPQSEAILINGSNNNVGIVNFQSNYWNYGSVGATCISSSSSSNKLKLGGFINFGASSSGTAGLGGVLSSYNWPMFNNGYSGAPSTDASGNITITHSLGFTPNFVNITQTEQWNYIIVLTNITSTTFTVKVYRSESSNTVAASVNVGFNYNLSM